MKTIRILILEDDLKTLAVIMDELNLSYPAFKMGFFAGKAIKFLSI